MVRCPRCMHPVEGDVCGACGHSVEMGELPRGALPMGTVVAERFEVGQCLRSTYQSLGYIAWDTKGRRYVMVTEFYPKFVASRVESRVVAKKNSALFEQARQMYFASHEEQGATLLMGLIANNTAYRIYALSCNPPEYGAALEEVLDHPVLFRSGDRPIMSVNALPIPEFPRQRAWQPSNRTLRMERKRKIRAGIIAACAALLVGGVGAGCYWYTRPQQVEWDIQSKFPVTKIAIVNEKSNVTIYTWPEEGSEPLPGDESWREGTKQKLQRGDYRIEVTNQQEARESAALHVPQEEPLVITLAERLELKETEWLYRVQNQLHLVGEETEKVISDDIEVVNEPKWSNVCLSFTDDIQEYQFYLQREETASRARLDASWVTQEDKTAERVMQLEVSEGTYSLWVSQEDAEPMKVKDLSLTDLSCRVDMAAVRFYWEICARLSNEDARLLTVGEQTRLLAGDEPIPVEMEETWMEEYPELMKPYLEAQKQQITVDISFTSDLKAEVKENAAVTIEGMPWHEGDEVQATAGNAAPYQYAVQFSSDKEENGTFAAQDKLALGAGLKEEASYADVRQVALIEGKYWFFYDDGAKTGTRDDYEALLQTARNFEVGVNLEKLNEEDAVHISLPEKIKEDKVKAAYVRLGSAEPIELNKESLMCEKELVIQTSFAPEEIELELTMAASDAKDINGNPIVTEDTIPFYANVGEVPTAEPTDQSSSESQDLRLIHVEQEGILALPEKEDEKEKIREAYRQKEWWGIEDPMPWNLEEIPFDKRLSDEWMQKVTFTIDDVIREFNVSEKLLLTEGIYTFTFTNLIGTDKSYQVTMKDNGKSTWQPEEIGVHTVDEWLKDTALVIIQKEGKTEEKKRLGENAEYMNDIAWTQSNLPTRRWEVRNECGKPMELVLSTPSYGKQPISFEAGESGVIEVFSADAGDGWKLDQREEDATSYQLNVSEDGVQVQIMPIPTPVPTEAPTPVPTAIPTATPMPTLAQTTIDSMENTVIPDGLDDKSQTESPLETNDNQEQPMDQEIVIKELQGTAEAGKYHQRIREGMMVYCTITEQTPPKEQGNNSINNWNINVELFQKKIPLINIQPNEQMIMLDERNTDCLSLSETKLIAFLQCLMNPDADVKKKTTEDGKKEIYVIYCPYKEMTWEEVEQAWKGFYNDWKYEQQNQPANPKGIE